jgi:cytochrome b6-f complex iron-sulfur subunit
MSIKQVGLLRNLKFVPFVITIVNLSNKKNMENNVINQPNTIERSEFLKQVGIGFGAIMLMNCIQGCSADTEIPDPNPTTSTKVDFKINLATTLLTDGSFTVNKTNNVIVARVNATTYLAVASLCTHEKAEITYRAATNDFRCPLHGSLFKSDGTVTMGPAATALKKFSTTVDTTNKELRVFE